MNYLLLIRDLGSFHSISTSETSQLLELGRVDFKFVGYFLGILSESSVLGSLLNIWVERKFNCCLCLTPFEITGQHKEGTLLWVSEHPGVHLEYLYHTSGQGSLL